jgi:hypothetical protein
MEYMIYRARLQSHSDGILSLQKAIKTKQSTALKAPETVSTFSSAQAPPQDQFNRKRQNR